MPICSSSCNGGRCTNNNLCDCTNTTYTGLYCDEHYKLERISSFDITIKIISVVLIIIVISIMIGIILLRNNPVIKGGEYNI